MTYRPTKATLRTLLALAQSQGGYFTAKQAAEIGYNSPHLDYHVHAGNFERAGHGFYRLPDVPLSEHDDLVRLAFWSRNQADHPQAVVSHQSALAVHGLSDLLPSKIHLTVPNSFRKATPKGVVLHRGKLDTHEVEQRDGFLVTTPLRTLVDIADDVRISEEHLHAAMRDAIDRGLVRKSRLLAEAKTRPAENRLLRSLSSVP